VKIQDAAIESAANGRPFLGLCSLVDHKLTGKITAADLIHTCKIMGCTISMDEIKALRELLPLRSSKDDKFDYRELFWLIENHEDSTTDRRQPSRTIDYAPKAIYSRQSANTLYSSTPVPPIRLSSRETPRTRDSMNFNSSINTPAGFTLRTPFNDNRQSLNATINTGYSDMRPDEVRVFRNISERLKIAVDDKSRSWGAPFSLKKQFEVYDSYNNGLVSVRTFQSTLDDLGVILSNHELYIIQTRYGRPEDDGINYLQFCMDVFDSDLRQSSRFDNRNSHSIRYSDPSYLTERLRELRNEGKDPRDIFEAYDLDETGMVYI
jgi:hypothetical protein